MFPVTDARKPHSLSVEEQEVLFRELPDHLLRMASYKVNAGNREEEVCSRKWAWERKEPELGASIFVIPGDRVKNAEDRSVVVSRIARSVVEAARGMHPESVFVRQEKDGRGVPLMRHATQSPAKSPQTPGLQLSRLFKAQFGHTQFVLDTIWARSKSMQHFPESHSGGIDQNSPG
jgi:hypothetical protein